jgi:hypothetical protein
VADKVVELRFYGIPLKKSLIYAIKKAAVEGWAWLQGAKNHDRHITEHGL